MNLLTKLVNDVATARNDYLKQIEGVAEQEAILKPDSATWNIIEITEHLFWAEQGALFGMWKTLYAIREGKLEATDVSIHKNLSIEEIIELTWQPKEVVPPVAAPRMGGTLTFWRASLNSLQEILESFGNDLKDEELRLQAHPHPISGPMDFQQRLEFLRFHLDRHREQAKKTIELLDLKTTES